MASAATCMSFLHAASLPSLPMKWFFFFFSFSFFFFFSIIHQNKTMTAITMSSSYTISNHSFSTTRCYSSSFWRRRRKKRIHHEKQVADNRVVVVSGQRRELLMAKARGSTPESRSEEKKKERRGTVIGAVSLIVGTSIGSGILALPQRTSPAGFIPSAFSLILCWVFLLIEAILLAEISVDIKKKKKKIEGEAVDLEVISLRTMAQETLGESGGNVAATIYLFLAYSSMVAYISKSGEVLSHMINLPPSISGALFTFVMAFLISVGGIYITDVVNQCLTIFMIGLLVAIEIKAFSFSDWLSSLTMSNWGEITPTIPVIIFSLVYHDIIPVICAYLGNDVSRIRFSIIIGSLLPLFTLLIWDGIALGLSSHSDGIDPLELLQRGRWSCNLPIVEVFSLLAVGTSLIGTLLGFSQFFVEQLNNYLIIGPMQVADLQEKPEEDDVQCVRRNDSGDYDDAEEHDTSKLNILATSIAVIPSLLVSSTVQDAFLLATDIAGGYCMTVLYGMLPPTMAWFLHSASKKKDSISKDEFIEEKDQEALLLVAKPVIVTVGLFSCGIVMEQLLHDLPLLLSIINK